MLEPATAGQVTPLAVAPRSLRTACAQPPLPLVWDGRGTAASERPYARVVHRAGQAPRPGAAGGLPEPGAWLVALLQTMREVVTGDRSRHQLRRWVGAEVYEWLGRASASSGPTSLGPTSLGMVRSVHVCEPAAGVVEATALVTEGGRVRAVALRLEAVHGRWCCNRLDLL